MAADLAQLDSESSGFDEPKQLRTRDGRLEFVLPVDDAFDPRNDPDARRACVSIAARSIAVFCYLAVLLLVCGLWGYAQSSAAVPFQSTLGGTLCLLVAALLLMTPGLAVGYHCLWPAVERCCAPVLRAGGFRLRPAIDYYYDRCPRLC